MPDREKVIKAAEICLRYIDDGDCPTECPYFDLCAQYEKRVVFQPLIRDALILLKEQEAVKHTSRKGTNGFSIVWTCGACGSDLHPNNAKAKYCSNCGKPVKWDA